MPGMPRRPRSMTLEEAMNLVLVLRRRIEDLEVDLAIHKAALAANPMNPAKPLEPQGDSHAQTGT
jgi:hypothetical protein